VKQSQYDRIGALIKRKKGATAMDIASVAGTVSPHSRLAEMRRAGWRIWRESIAGKNYGVYRGKAPQGT
jgi:hypothetical protein